MDQRQAKQPILVAAMAIVLALAIGLGMGLEVTRVARVPGQANKAIVEDGTGR